MYAIRIYVQYLACWLDSLLVFHLFKAVYFAMPEDFV